MSVSFSSPMKVRVIGDTDASSIAALKMYIFSFGLSTSIEVVESCENPSGDILDIQVTRTDAKALLLCPKLDFSCELDPENLNRLVLKCCGYKETVLNGLAVKDVNNNKTRPTIPIVSNVTLSGCLPDKLEYSKYAFQELKPTLVRQRVYFNSEILSSVLSSTSLCFTSNNQCFKLFYEDSAYFVQFAPTPDPASLDFLLDRTVNENLLKHMKIRKNHPVFDSFLTGKSENLVFNKKYYKRIKSSRKDMEDLVDFIEHVPKFQDSRDNVINELREFIYENYPLEYIHKYQYLEVYKSKALRNRNKSSLKKFAGL